MTRRAACRDWWTKADFAHFQQSGQALVAQFNAYRLFPDLTVNGAQTLGENIADNAGLTAAYDAWRYSLNGKPAPMDQTLGGEQQFFLGFAQEWGEKMRECGAPGSPGGSTPCRNSAPWKCATWMAGMMPSPSGRTKQYLEPAKRVHVWQDLFPATGFSSTWHGSFRLFEDQLHTGSGRVPHGARSVG